MQDHPDIPSLPPHHGLRPETWAVAEYDALREALNVLLAATMAEIDDCAKWLGDHETVVAAGGIRRSSLAAWVRHHLEELETLDDRLLSIRNGRMPVDRLRLELAAMTAAVSAMALKQWPLHLDSPADPRKTTPGIAQNVLNHE